MTDTHTDADNGLSGGPSFGCKCGLAVVGGDGDGDGGGGGDKPGGLWWPPPLLAMPLGSGGMTGGGGLGLYRLTGSGGAIFGIAGMPAMSVSSSIIFPHHDPSKSSSSSPSPLSWSWPWWSPLAS